MVHLIQTIANSIFSRCGRANFNCTAKFEKEPTGAECKECASTGYTYEEHRVFMGEALSTIKDKTWQECALECDKNRLCFAFAYQTVTKNCFLKKSSDGEPIYKQNFIFSRSCGSSEYDCPTRECNTCASTGYTTELGYYGGSSLKTLTKKTKDECAAECEKELDCVATYYTSNNQYCYLKSTVTGTDRPPTRSTNYYYQRR